MCLRKWHSDEPSTPSPLIPEDKAILRGSIVGLAVVQRDAPILNALSDVTRWVFGHDFPDRWPELPGMLLAILRGSDPHAIAGAALLTREMFKHFEFKNDEGQAPSAMLGAALFPALAQLYGSVLGSFTTPEAARVLRLILKAYHSAMHHHLDKHACLVAPEGVITWLGLLWRTLTRPLPQPGEPGEPVGMPAAESARPDWCWWRTRKWAAKIFSVWAERWGQPKVSSSVRRKASTQPLWAGTRPAQLPVSCGR